NSGDDGREIETTMSNKTAAGGNQISDCDSSGLDSLGSLRNAASNDNDLDTLVFLQPQFPFHSTKKQVNTSSISSNNQTKVAHKNVLDNEVRSSESSVIQLRDDQCIFEQIHRHYLLEMQDHC
ncbi:MAG: hypothetical protein MHMPM18_004555, partial [Marteilia pararefringens]